MNRDSDTALETERLRFWSLHTFGAFAVRVVSKLVKLGGYGRSLGDRYLRSVLTLLAGAVLFLNTCLRCLVLTRTGVIRVVRRGIVLSSVRMHTHHIIE